MPAYNASILTKTKYRRLEDALKIAAFTQDENLLDIF
jgi:hypothetical protein